MQKTPKHNLRHNKGNAHQGTEMYECRVCQKVFYAAMELKNHLIVVHIKEQTYPCSSCGELFLNKALLDIHISMNHNNSCLDCDAVFSDPHKLKLHKLSHQDEKLHSCDVCHKTFGNKISLNSHQLKHSGEKSHLKVHSRLHTDKKLYASGKSFQKRITRSVSVSSGKKRVSKNVPVLPANRKTTQNMAASGKGRKSKSSVSVRKNKKPAAKRRVLPKAVQDELKSAALQHELRVTVSVFQQMDSEALEDDIRVEDGVFSTHKLAECLCNADGDFDSQKGNTNKNKCIHSTNKENIVPTIKRKIYKKIIFDNS